MWAWNRTVLIRGEALTWDPALVRGYTVVNQSFENLITIKFKSHQMFM